MILLSKEEISELAENCIDCGGRNEVEVAQAQLRKVHGAVLEIKNDIDARGIESPEAYGVFVGEMVEFMQALLKEVK